MLNDDVWLSCHIGTLPFFMAKNWLRNHQPIMQKNAVFLRIEKMYLRRKIYALVIMALQKVTFLRIFAQMVDENLSLDCYSILNVISTN